MDIGKLSMNLALQNVQTDVGTKMLSNAMKVSENEGNQIIDMINKASLERSVNPNIGNNIDLTV